MILFNAAVIMGVQIGQPLFFIQRVLLDVDAGGVDVRAKDIHALAHGLAADDEQHDVLLHPSAIYTVAGNKLAARTNDLIQIPETGGLRLLHGFGNALALRLTGVQKRDIALAERFHLLQLGFFISGPGILFVHDELPSCPRAPWHAAVPLEPFFAACASLCARRNVRRACKQKVFAHRFSAAKYLYICDDVVYDISQQGL